MKSDLVRPMFCKNCFDAKRPHSEDRFVLKNKNGLEVYKLDWNPPVKHYGFTPHLIDEYQDKNDKVVIETFCLMENCGVRIEPRKDNTFTIYLKVAKYFALFKKDWIALQSYIDPDYSLL